MIDYAKSYNEDLFHIFGYVKDDERLPNNNTPFLDFNGKADPEHVKKINYYKTLNEKAMQKRMKIRHGDLARDENKICVGPKVAGGRNMISLLNIVSRIELFKLVEFMH